MLSTLIMVGSDAASVHRITRVASDLQISMNLSQSQNFKNTSARMFLDPWFVVLVLLEHKSCSHEYFDLRDHETYLRSVRLLWRSSDFPSGGDLTNQKRCISRAGKYF